MRTFEDLLARWADAEARGDAAALDALLHPDFRGDGPHGTVLGKQRWVDCHRSGDLRRAALAWRPTALRVGHATAVAIGVQSQVASYRGEDWSGAFVCTLVAVRHQDAWTVVNVQLSERIHADRPPRALEIGHVADVLRTALYERGGHGNHP